MNSFRKYMIIGIIPLFLLLSGCGGSDSPNSDAKGGTDGDNSNTSPPLIKLFSANDGVHGSELWKTDGTEAGTTLVKDINTLTPIDPKGFTSFGYSTYFSADDGVHGRELWRKNRGASALVADIIPGETGSDPKEFTLTGNAHILFFEANGELWKVNENGKIVRVKDIFPGDGHSSPKYLTATDSTTDSTIYFQADDGTNGAELWKSDGTEAGTVMVKDIRPGNSSSAPQFMTVMDNVLYFSADDGTSKGRELWKSDGTEAGTVMVKDINTLGTQSSDPRYFTVMKNDNNKNYLYFSALTSSEGRELWRSDGTSDGTRMVKNINSVQPKSSNPEYLTVIDNKLYFSAKTGTQTELWESDGNPDTPATTKMVRDIAGTTSSNPAHLTVMKGKLYFAATTSNEGRELFDYEPSTDIIEHFNIAAGSDSSDPDHLTVLLDNSNTKTLLFSADDGIHGRELWKINNNTGNAVIAKDINTTGSSNPTELMSDKGKKQLFLSADNGVTGRRVMTYSYGRTEISEAPSSRSYNFVKIGKITYFIADDGVNGNQLWKSDGTATGTKIVKNFGKDVGIISNLTAFGSYLYFSWRDKEHGRELWQSDGTESGTRLLKDIWPGSNSSSPQKFTAAGDLLYFTAYVGGKGKELWRTDGTKEGTRIVENYYGNTSSNPYLLTAVGSSLYFALNPSLPNFHKFDLSITDSIKKITTPIKVIENVTDRGLEYACIVNNTLFFTINRATGIELWKSDGTGETTVKINEIRPGDQPAKSIINLTAMNSVLYFTAKSENFKELWRSDGTKTGTKKVKSIFPVIPRAKTPFAVLNNTIYFRSFDAEHGSELWKSDGTEAGTVFVKDIAEGKRSSYPSRFWRRDGYLYFTANDSRHGTELWKTDGTENGTVIVKDIYPGTGSSL